MTECKPLLLGDKLKDFKGNDGVGAAPTINPKSLTLYPKPEPETLQMLGDKLKDFTGDDGVGLRMRWPMPCRVPWRVTRCV